MSYTPRPNDVPFSIIIDTREQQPWHFPDGVEIENRALKTGDYSLSGHEDSVTIERKSLDDFVQSVTHHRKRFWSELRRMQEIPHRCIIVEGSMTQMDCGLYRSNANRNAVVAIAANIAAEMDVPIYFAGNASLASRWAFLWLRFKARVLKKGD